MSDENQKYEYVRHFDDKTIKINAEDFAQKRTDSGLIDIVFVGKKPKTDEKTITWRVI